ncbi:3-ketodihydrosphingosine reductase [Smittium culicis]|uniref:3-dehydrosphinganine reductase n=1 Tax=Smittium culicis TaxID=133412 RepID=A0A1R1Y1T4_9FUNG|nr:3-ketodihydrosphingosine reductase [Smittium culicis]
MLICFIQAFRVNETQKILIISADCSNYIESCKAIQQSISEQGQIPETVFTCAGTSYPGLFIEQDISVFEKSMQLNYFGSLYTIHEASKKMIENGIRGNIILIGSTLSMLSFIGFSQYSPTKFAIKGLAESLRSELLAYGINVSVYLPGTILSPGLEQENLTKPQITKDLEGAEDGLTPEQCADALVSGLKRGESIITSDLISSIFRVSTRGTD